MSLENRLARAFPVLMLALILASSCRVIKKENVGTPDVPLMTAGPMLGHVSDTSATVWFRAAEGAKISASAKQDSLSASVEIVQLGRGFSIARFGSLKAATPTEATIVLELNGRATEHLRFTTAPPPSDIGTVRIAFGSCNKNCMYPKVPVFEAMAAEKPDLALFVGDNSYFIVGDGGQKNFSTSGPKGDWSSPETMIARHMETRTLPEFQPLLRSIPCYAVWDDHDYGPNNSDRTLASKNDALEVFKSVWANPSYGTLETPGIFGSFRRGPVEVFLMDDRYNKYVKTDEHADVKPEEAVIWGEAQLRWLMTGLKASTAPVKFIANGTQVITESKGGEGHFREAPVEREKLFTFLRENKIGGVVFLSGDRHYSESLRLDQKDGPAILEFTSSPLQQNQAIKSRDQDKHRTRLWAMNGNSYGLVTVEIPEKGKGTIRFEARDETNHGPILNAHRCVTTTDLRALNY